MKAPTGPTDLLSQAAKHLGLNCERVVFVGGTTVSLIIVDPGSASPRVTDDVDCIVGVEKRSEYYEFTGLLERSGFCPDPEGPICRYTIDDLKIDIMPTDPDILGFSNRWFKEGLESSVEAVLPGGTKLRILTAPYFIASKCEAFLDRGECDYWSSHDLEDMIAVIEGCPNIVSEIGESQSPSLVKYLSDKMASLLENDKFREALPGHLPPDPASQARTSIVLDRMRGIAGLL